jgi:hypothetical protein
LLALLVYRTPAVFSYGMAIVVALAALAAVVMLERFPYERQSKV